MAFLRPVRVLTFDIVTVPKYFTLVEDTCKLVMGEKSEAMLYNEGV